MSDDTTQFSGSSVSKVAIIGMGCQYPGANGLRSLWENILARRKYFRSLPQKRLPLAEYYCENPATPDKTFGSQAAVIDGFEFDWIHWRIPHSTVQSTDIVHWLALETAHQALQDAGYSHRHIPAHKTGVIVGNTLTGEQTRANTMRLRWPYVRRSLRAAAQVRQLSATDTEKLLETMEEIYKSVFPPITEDSLAGSLSNTIAGRICNSFNFDGGGFTVDGACASSLLAIATAANALTNGDLDLALAGGVDVSLDTFELIGFSKTGALTSTEMSVYDRRANGFIPGEGCGFVVLKRLEDARANGDYVYAVLNGWGISSDGKGSITAPTCEGQAKALQRAYRKAGYSPHQLNFIEGHGTGTPVGDRIELKGIASAVKANGAIAPRSIGITSFKSIVGHTKAAAGIGGLIKAAMAVNQRVIPPTAGCKTPNTEFDTSALCLYPVLTGTVCADTEVLYAGVSAMGFGGINSHVTLSSGDAPAPHLKPALEVRSLLASPQETELFVLSATSLEGLLEQVQSVSEQAAGMSSSELVDLAAHLALNSAPVQPVRAAMLASTPDELAERLQQFAHLLRHQPPKTGESSVLDQSVWLSNHVKRNRIGFLFPGQGSQKLNMSRTLVERYGWAQDLIHQCDQWLVEWRTKPLESVMYRALERAVSHAEIAQWQQELSQTEIAQPAVCLASLLWCRRLERLGLKPTVVGGHSLGELTAFQAAGAFDEQTLLKLAAVRGQAMKASDQSGAMVSLSCSQTKAQALLRLVSGYGVVANLNSPQQTVISGEVKTLAAVVKLAEAQEIRTRVLPVSAAFHSRLIASSAQALQAISFLPQSLGELSCMLFSSVPGSQIQHGLKLREHFATQVSSQVDFISLAHAVAANCDLLIEVGPGQVLSRLTHDFDNLGQRCLPIESKPSHDEDLNRILATFFIQGGEINWTALYEDRFIRPFVPASARQFIENPCERPYPLQALATPRDSSVTNTESAPSETLLPHNTNLEATLSQYFVEHSAFIAQLIAKDLRAFESSPQRSSTLSQVHTHSGETLLQQPSDVLTFDSFASRNGKLLVPPIPSHPRTTELERLDPKFDTTNIHEFLFQLVEEQTGFPTATLSLHSRLLDDLNLDSIKAAELIATAAKRLGVGGTLDPNLLANATLKDLISALRSAQTQTESIKSGMLGDTQTLEPESSWVRNFSFTYIPQALPVATPHWTANSWTTAKVLIVAEATEQDLVNALNQQLDALGAQTNSVSYSDSALQQQCSSATHCLAILPRSSAAQLPLEHLIARLQSIAQPRAQLNTCLAYIQFGGGEYGRSGLEHPATCCAAAFARSLHLEQPHQRIRVIDLSTELETQEMAQSILQELVGSEGIATVGYDRHGLRYGPQVAVQQPITYKPRTISWSAKDVILVTGGAKGITAECALAFAQSTGASMALVGRSPTPTLDDSSSEVAQTLARFQSLGIPHRYYPCDITETVAVQDLITAVIQDLGPIAGLIHGAGLNQPRRQETVKLEEAYCEVSPKLLGAENLLQHLEASTLKMVVGFSSIIAITGMPGNAWYGFANEVLDLQLRHYHHQHPATQVLSLAYSVWDEVGMGARLGSVTTLERMGIAAIPVSEGVQRFLKLMHFNPGDNQVIITARLGGLDTWSPISLPDSASLRFIERVTSIEPGVELVTRTKLRLEQDYYLQDHFWRGSHLFPTVFGLEAMVQASAYVMGTLAPTVARIESISLLRPIVVDPKVGVELEIHAEVLETTVLGEQQIHVGLRTEQTGFSLDHFSATVVLSPRGQESPLALDLTEPLDLDPQTDLYGNLLFQGQRFQRMETLYRLTSTQAVLQTSIQPQVDQARNSFAGLGRVLLLGDPYVRDVLLQSVQLTIPQDLCLPVYIEHIEWFNASACSDERIVTAQLLHKEGEEYFANVVATDPKGTVLERITGYRIRILELVFRLKVGRR